MEILGGLLLITVLLTLLGSVTALAFASMVLLGLVTEMSFRRLFFVSFGIGLLAPLGLAIWASSAVSEESFQLELLTELNQVVSGSENVMGALPRIQELRQQLSDGTITPDEFETQLEQLIEETSGAQIELEGPEITPEAGVQTDSLPEGE
ncbi:hypothetical protein FGU71_11680 [Erythrobacter insulae]|uniref:SHOCT domain-containing protein n=1 Tax=Erythrobacter insulae TaxID=2584124 RepID=A0A547PEB0_9SPHN|nr:hypothetical protein [Erythrobacter insulae]TRD12458.1 hypothetical protein FGU71_11680 [Erythrobacter insulae]